MLQAGVAPVNVSIAFGCTQATIFNLRRRFVQRGNVGDRHMSGRPRSATLRDDRAIRLSHLRDRFLTSTVTAAHYNVSPQTIRNRLRR